jgi:hypothetical protein
MSGPKRNPDSINTIGIVVVGICGAVMVYVSITALQAFYMNDSSEIQTMADYGGQDTVAKSHKADEMRKLNVPDQGIAIDLAMAAIVKSADDARAAGKPATLLVPGACEENMPTEVPQPGRPVLDMTRIGGCKGGKAPPTPAAPPAGAGSADTCDEVGCVLNNYQGACCDKFRQQHGAGSGAGSAAPAAGNGKTGKAGDKKAGKGAGSGDTGANIHLHSTSQGAAGDTHAVGGTSGAPVGNPDSTNAGSAAKLAPGGHAP